MIYKCPICARVNKIGKIKDEGIINCVYKYTIEHYCYGNCGNYLKVTFNPEKVPFLFGLFQINGKEYKSVDVRVIINLDSGFTCPKCKAPYRPPLQCIDDCKQGYQQYTSKNRSCIMCGLKYNATFIPYKNEYKYSHAELEIQQ